MHKDKDKLKNTTESKQIMQKPNHSGLPLGSFLDFAAKSPHMHHPVLREISAKLPWICGGSCMFLSFHKALASLMASLNSVFEVFLERCVPYHWAIPRWVLVSVSSMIWHASGHIDYKESRMNNKLYKLSESVFQQQTNGHLFHHPWHAQMKLFSKETRRF